MDIVWRHYSKTSATTTSRVVPVSAHAFASGGHVSACGAVMADSPRLEPGERSGDLRCRGCERAIERHGGDIPYGVINVDLETHSALQVEALRVGRSIRAIADEVIAKALDAAGAPRNDPPAQPEARRAA